jgi:putative flippase GtrA
MVGLLSQPVITNLLADIESKVSIPALLLRIGVFFVMAIGAPAAVFLFSVAARWIPVLYQIAKFACVGVSNTFVDLGVLNTVIFFTGISSGTWYPVFKTGSFLVSTTNSFLWNRNWTFEEGKHKEKAQNEAVQFYVITTISWLVNVSVASGIVNYVAHGGISDNLWANIGALAGVFTAMTFNFLGYKFVVFKKPAPAPQEAPAPQMPPKML